MGQEKLVPLAIREDRTEAQLRADGDYRGVATCEVCGGKYRPAGGPCVHSQTPEHRVRAEKALRPDYVIPGPHWAPGGQAPYWALCGLCQSEWNPGHTCIRQPTAEEVRQLAETAFWLRVADELLAACEDIWRTPKPEPWEAL